MSQHPDIQKIAALSFADHRLTKGPGRSWRMGKPKTGAYSFRVTWTPGVLIVSGDIGSAVYQVWPSFGTLWSAIDLVSNASFDYLAGKSGVQKEFDRDETVSSLIRYAYESLRSGHQDSFFKHVCDEYGGDPDNYQDRKEAVREFRDDDSLTAERVYNITGDFKAPTYSLPASARWTYEAVHLWAATMQAREPAWHRLWRMVLRERDKLKDLRRARKHFRPALYTRLRSYSYPKFWARVPYHFDGVETARMAAVIPLMVFGLDLSVIGLWREQGSSWPLGSDGRDADFVPFTGGRTAAPVVAS